MEINKEIINAIRQEKELEKILAVLKSEVHRKTGKDFNLRCACLSKIDCKVFDLDQSGIMAAILALHRIYVESEKKENLNN